MWLYQAERYRLLLVKAALQWVVDFQQLDDVRPAQLVRQCLTFLRIRKRLIKQPHVDQVGPTEAPAVAQTKIARQIADLVADQTPFSSLL